ncbi:MAG: hypothetical protein OEZ13_09565 [Spirochaetia bacterium]|nr:hypothetical protein [Spirochaetia bacterium]
MMKRNTYKYFKKYVTIALSVIIMFLFCSKDTDEPVEETAVCGDGVVEDSEVCDLSITGVCTSDCTGYASDSYESDDTTGAAQAIVANGTDQLHTIDSTSDIDYFSFVVLSADITNKTIFSIETSDGSGGCAMDTYIQVYDIAGDKIQDTDWFNNDGGTGTCSKLRIQFDGVAHTAGTYYFQVSHRYHTENISFGGGTPTAGYYYVSFTSEQITNTAPVADASRSDVEGFYDSAAGIGLPVILDATASFDPDKDACKAGGLTYSWSVTDSTPVEVFVSTDPMAIFVPGQADNYLVNLTVTDNAGWCSGVSESNTLNSIPLIVADELLSNVVAPFLLTGGVNEYPLNNTAGYKDYKWFSFTVSAANVTNGEWFAMEFLERDTSSDALTYVHTPWIGTQTGDVNVSVFLNSQIVSFYKESDFGFAWFFNAKAGSGLSEGTYYIKVMGDTGTVDDNGSYAIGLGCYTSSPSDDRTGLVLCP